MINLPLECRSAEQFECQPLADRYPVKQRCSNYCVTKRFAPLIADQDDTTMFEALGTSLKQAVDKVTAVW